MQSPRRFRADFVDSFRTGIWGLIFRISDLAALKNEILERVQQDIIMRY